ncbi:Gfo/Idh/MocA family protein [Paucihalobacter sp.]|uniref:Gfo/Idh/MocA family protein n=1 Tax=Paucihalobacter sp. TaxID=2850405 RepID=UPI002FDFB0FB
MPDRIIHWGIIGLGNIAHKFAEDLLKVPRCELVAVASRSKAKSKAFAETFKAKKAYANYEELLQDPKVNAVYIATPHTYHFEHALLSLKYGKAVLCEKPFAMHTAQVQTMITAAKAHNLLLMEALWTNFLPHYKKALEVIHVGAIGKILHLEADFGFHPSYDGESRVFKKELGGGSLLDIGIYPIFAALSSLGMPKKIEARASFFENGADSSCDMHFKYNDKVEAKLHSTFLANTDTKAVFTGTCGVLEIHGRFHQPSSFTVTLKDEEPVTYHFKVPYHGYFYEIDHFNQLLRQNKTESDVMTFQRSLNLMELLDTVRSKIALQY